MYIGCSIFNLEREARTLLLPDEYAPYDEHVPLLRNCILVESCSKKYETQCIVCVYKVYKLYIVYNVHLTGDLWVPLEEAAFYTLYSIQYTLYNVHLTGDLWVPLEEAAFYTLYSIQYTLYNVHLTGDLWVPLEEAALSFCREFVTLDTHLACKRYQTCYFSSSPCPA